MQARGCWALCSGQPGPRSKPRTGRVCWLPSALWPQPDWRYLSFGECGRPGQGRGSPTPLGLTYVQQIEWTVMQFFCPVSSLRTVWGPGPGKFWRGNRVRATEAEQTVGLSRLCGARNTSPWDLRTWTGHTWGYGREGQAEVSAALLGWGFSCQPFGSRPGRLHCKSDRACRLRPPREG